MVDSDFVVINKCFEIPIYRATEKCSCNTWPGQNCEDAGAMLYEGVFPKAFSQSAT